jgi:hypothetical protein
MSNDSSTGGALLPLPAPAPVPIEDDALIDFFQTLVVSITGLPGDMVRPRWQPEAPNIPPAGTNWCGIGITKQKRDTFAAEIHNPAVGDTPGYDELRRHELITVLASFYGPNANSMASQFSDGMQVAQNREVLSQNNMGYVEGNDIINIPQLIKEIWYYRSDFEFIVKRQLRRFYQVLDLNSASGGLNTDVPPRSVAFDVTPSENE